MQFISKLLDILLHLDVHMNDWAGAFGPWIYVILFLIIFCETGLVVTPFLPGDSLLFALGALTATDGAYLNFTMLSILLTLAAIFGNLVNYAIGRYFGPRIFHRTDSIWLNKKHLEKTQAFYDKHGGKTIILTRFMPIVRTFAPFVAGIGKMDYTRFVAYNIAGGFAWVMIFLIAGNCFGNIPSVKQNFHIVIVAIIVVSFLPVLVEYIRARQEQKLNKTA